MCSAFTPDCGYYKSTILLIGDVYCPNTKCSGKFCLHKKTFESLGRSDYQCPQCASVCQVRNISFEDQKIPFSCHLVKGFTFLKRVKSRCYWRCLLHWQVLFQQKECESLGGYVETPRSIYGCGKCWAWLFVHKVLFMLQEHVKTTQTDKTRFFC